MEKNEFTLANESPERLRSHIEGAAREHGVVVDFLMRRWNGRFATYNLGRDISEDEARSAKEFERGYRLIGRVKFNTLPDGDIRLSLSPPTHCDPNPQPADEALFDAFRSNLLAHIDVEATG